MKELIQQALTNARTYPDYRAYLTELLAAGKTTGPNQSEAYVQYARLNQSRMDRLDKRNRFLPEMAAELAQLDQAMLMLVITEGWCGDAAQLVPLLYHLTEATPKLDLLLVLRDEHPELMDQFLTDGARSIPKVIFLDAATHTVLGDWGPRPAFAQQMTMDYKHQAPPKADYATYQKELHTWYARDKTASAQRELLDVFRAMNPNE